MDKRMRKRILMTVLGIFAGGVSVGFFKTAAFGVDPFQTLMSGLDKLIPIHFGTLYVLTNAVLLLFAFFTDRHYINLGTFINLFLLGYVVEFSHNLLLRFFPEPALPLRLLFMLIAIFMLCISSSFYFTADLGVSTYDAIALVLANKWHVAPFKYCRIATDLACVLLGCTLYLLAGGKFSMLPTIAGFGTIITAFFMGPLIDYFNIHLAKPFLEKE
ncbi:MAG: YczE/YyaS/YitT family protein [Marvinbryantia sp.]|uniref:YczE/YyaS/YitT family protein n=1 Tax=Marvinbryantia sp. TaxID=2496532 RepID=UPI002664E777|nr:hypothetical protein [uncultured Marvinbryantia sp.]